MLIRRRGPNPPLYSICAMGSVALDSKTYPHSGVRDRPASFSKAQVLIDQEISTDSASRSFYVAQQSMAQTTCSSAFELLCLRPGEFVQVQVASHRTDIFCSKS